MFHSLSPYLSSRCLLSLCCTWVCSRSSGLTRQLGSPPAPLELLSCTRRALARRTWDWHQWRCQNSFAYSPGLTSPYLPLLCPAVYSAAPLDPGRYPSPLRGWCRCPLGVPGGWGFSIPSMPPYLCTHHSVAFEGQYGGFVPPGQIFHSGGVGAPWQLDPPSHSLATPPGVFYH